eukprot:EG_transcript_4654
MARLTPVCFALLCTAMLWGAAGDYVVGPAGVVANASLPAPTGAGAPLAVQGATLCQKVTVPSTGMVVTWLGVYAAPRNSSLPASGLNVTLSLYNATSLLAQSASTAWQWGVANALPLPGQPLVPAGLGYICLTALNASAPVLLATEATSADQLRFAGSALPASMAGPVTTGPSASLYLMGASGTISSFPTFESFDSWPRCDPNGCSIVSGPCPLHDGWRNPATGDFDWSVHNNVTQTRSIGRNTGPQSDHTTGTAAGNYLYTETSPPCGSDVRPLTAHMLTPVLLVYRSWVVRVNFWLSMYGLGDTELHYDASFDGGRTFVLDVQPAIRGNQGDCWIPQTVDLTQALWVNDQKQGVVLRFRSVVGTNDETSFVGDVAIDDVNFTAYTGTPTPTATASTSSTVSSTLTPIPTRTGTPTVVPTATPTVTATRTPERDYVPVGIPDPPQLVSPGWASVQPTTVVVAEAASLQLTGYWVYGAYGRVDVKFAVWAENCLDQGVGSNVTILDPWNIAHIQVPTVVGRYMLCIRHRQDWEEVAVINVIPQNVNYSTFGYTTCQQLLRFNPQYCGCWVRKGDPGVPQPPVYTLPLDKPAWLLPYRPETVIFEQGCCRRGTGQRFAWQDRRPPVPLAWGVCQDSPPEGQLGNFSCPAA